LLKKIRKIREKFMQMENMQMTLMDRWRATKRDNGTWSFRLLFWGKWSRSATSCWASVVDCCCQSTTISFHFTEFHFVRHLIPIFPNFISSNVATCRLFKFNLNWLTQVTWHLQSQSRAEFLKLIGKKFFNSFQLCRLVL